MIRDCSFRLANCSTGIPACEYLPCCRSGRWPARRIDDEAQSCRPHHEESNREPRGDVVGYDHPGDGNKREREQPPPLRLSCVNRDKKQIDGRDGKGEGERLVTVLCTERIELRVRRIDEYTDAASDATNDKRAPR